MSLTIMQPKSFGEGEREYTMEQFVELFTWHSKQLFNVLDVDDPNFVDEWQEIMEFDKKIEKKAMERSLILQAQDLILQKKRFL